MKIKEIIPLIEATIITGKHRADYNITKAFASDLMSDVLTVDSENLLLITGLSNIQTLRTAEMLDIKCVIIARGKKCSEDMAALAEELKISVIESDFSLFRISGILYQQGIQPVF